VRRGDLADIADLVDKARALYDDDPAAVELLDGNRRRLKEPLRLAVAGMVKAGKSTILNAIIGEQIAPTDAGECTKIVTWYRHAHSARITAHLHDGGEARLPVKRSRGALVLDLGDLSADDVESIDVEWPSESLRSTVLIDTPGIASLSESVSARSTRFLTPEKAPSIADAILYLLRHIHASDVSFLEAFHDTAAGAPETVNAVALLSRADEVGSGRIDSLLSAARIADRYRRDGELRSLALGCIPVAGLLAEGARTLREQEFTAFRTLANLDRGVRDRMFISVDRFSRGGDESGLSSQDRKALLSRFGIFGVRLATTLVRAGATSSSELADRMVQQSGLVEVQRFVSEQFRARALALKARGVIGGLQELLREKQRDGTAALLTGLERITASSHDLRELAVLAQVRTTVLPLPAESVSDAERIVGGSGTSMLARLGLPDTADTAQMRTRVDELLARWRALSESPLTDRATVELCRVVVRSIEGVASDLPGTGSRALRRSTGDIVSASAPLESGR